jgi:hypothetical protein
MKRTLIDKFIGSQISIGREIHSTKMDLLTKIY